MSRTKIALLALIPLILGAYGASGAKVGGNIYDGTEVAIDLPVDQHVKNIAAPKDGLGNCVWATLDMNARWVHCEKLIGIINKIEYGGGYPEKLDKVMKEFAPDVPYVQYEGEDTTILERAIQSGRPVGVTYGYGERYQMQRIAHAVLLAHIDASRAAIIDNNYPGTWEWMDRSEFEKRWKYPSGKGWAYLLLEPPPPPVPSN